jgi:hypothetical protein
MRVRKQREKQRYLNLREEPGLAKREKADEQPTIPRAVRDQARRWLLAWGEVERYEGPPHSDEERTPKRDPSAPPSWLIVHAWVDGWIVRNFGKHGREAALAKWRDGWEWVLHHQYSFSDGSGSTDWISLEAEIDELRQAAEERRPPERSKVRPVDSVIGAIRTKKKRDWSKFDDAPYDSKRLCSQIETALAEHLAADEARRGAA